jgi:hypothetical protein
LILLEKQLYRQWWVTETAGMIHPLIEHFT